MGEAPGKRASGWLLEQTLTHGWLWATLEQMLIHQICLYSLPAPNLEAQLAKKAAGEEADATVQVRIRLGTDPLWN